MKQLITVLIVSFFIFNTSQAQITFEKTYPLQISSVGNSVKQTLDGGYIVGGTYVTKTTDSGAVEWIFPKAADYVNTTVDSGYIVIQNNGDIVFTKLDYIGDTVWTSTYGAGLWAREGNSIEQTADGGYIVAGRFQDFSGSGMMLLKLNSQGVASWRRTFWEPTSAAFAFGQNAHQTSDGGYIMVGHTYIDYYNANRHKDIMVVKTDSAGTQQWVKYYGDSTTEDLAYSIQEINNGEYIVAGSSLDSASSITKMSLLKLNNLGDTLWTKSYGGAHTSEFKSLGLTTEGGFILTGSSNIGTNGGTTNVSVFRTDSTGNILWTKEFGGNYADGGNEIMRTADGGYVLTGLANANTIGNGVMYLIKMDSTGTVNTPLSIEPEYLSEVEISLYPNPSNGKIYLETEIANLEIRVYNLEGKEVYSYKLVKGKNSLQVGDLAKGIYLYQVGNPLSTIQQGKIILK